MTKLIAAALALTLGTTGCKSEEKASDGVATVTETETETGTGTPTEWSKWKKDETMDCPTHVKTATVKMKDTETGYSLSIRSPDPADAKRILEYGIYVAKAGFYADKPEEALNFGSGTRNRHNNCPVILGGTRVNYLFMELLDSQLV